MCLINDYSLIDDPNIFVYGSTECATISLECTKVKLVNVILNNFEHSYQNKISLSFTYSTFLYEIILSYKNLKIMVLVFLVAWGVFSS